MFKEYPKERIEMSKELQEIYALQYKENRQGKSAAASLSQRVESWMHKQVANDLSILNSENSRTLEIGAGTLNQIPFENNNKGLYDIIEPFHKLYEDSQYLSRITNYYDDISEISLAQKYDRITSVACFEHVLNLPEVVAKAGILLTETGEVRTAIPSEGTFLWTLGWKLTTGLEFRVRYKLDYGELMRYEHVNTAREIEEILRYFFEEVSINVFGLTKSISIYQFLVCRKPIIERCENYLGSMHRNETYSI